MVGKKRSVIRSEILKGPNQTITPLSRISSQSRRIPVAGSSGVNIVSAKTSDILSVLDHSDSGLSVGHIVEAQPVSVGINSLGWYLGEIVAMKMDNDGVLYCYIHFLTDDSKVDDWIPRCDVRVISSTVDLEKRLKMSTLAFFGLSSFSATSSSIHPRHHIKTIRGVQLGNSVVLKAWYPSPYPEMISGPNAYIKLCDTCLSYFKTTHELARHWNHCAFSHPPGIEIYRHHEDDQRVVSVFEIDGELHNGYCERLLLLAKLFLEEKRAFTQDNSQYAQVRTFHFYVLCEWNNGKGELVGYFSKLKNNNKESHILSCILVLPHKQRMGYGVFLIDLAYQLSKIEGRIGSAERPLSNLGQLLFYPYWMKKIAPVLNSTISHLNIQHVSQNTQITPEDVCETLKYYGMLKEWGTAGAVVVLNKTPIDIGKSKRGIVFNQTLLQWTPIYKFFQTAISGG